MYSPLMLSSSTQQHITSLFFFLCQRTEVERSAKACQGENNNQRLTPHHLSSLLFPLLLSPSGSPSLITTSIFSLLLLGNRQEEHHLETSKPQEELAGRRHITQMFHGGNRVYPNSQKTRLTPFSALLLETVMTSRKDVNGKV